MTIDNILTFTPEKPGQTSSFSTPDKHDLQGILEEATPPASPRTPPRSLAGRALPKGGSLWATNSADSTPSKEKTPIPQTPKTPAAIKELREDLENISLACDLDREESERLEENSQALANLASPLHSEQQEKASEAIKKNLRAHGKLYTCKQKLIFVLDPEEISLPAVRKAVDAAQIKKEDVIYCNGRHIEKFDGKGFHICPPGSEHDNSVFDRITHPTTQVWCGTLKTPDQQKFSTFIPRTMTSDDFFPLVEEAKSRLIVRDGNKSILQTLKGFFIEVYNHGANYIHSAFPLFHLEKYDGRKEIFSIPYNFQATREAPLEPRIYEVPYKEVISRAQQTRKFEYQTPHEVFVDIGTLNLGCPIPKGVLVAIPKSLLNIKE